MNGYRKMMVSNGGNIGWCKPYITDDGKIAFVECEGVIINAAIDGADLPTTTSIYSYPNRQHLTDESLVKLARSLHGGDYDLYEGYSNDELVTFAVYDGKIRERDCADCPFFHDCEAMENPDTWDEMPESKLYPDD